MRHPRRAGLITRRICLFAGKRRNSVGWMLCRSIWSAAVCVLLVAIFEVLAILMLLAAFSAAARADDLAGDR